MNTTAIFVLIWAAAAAWYDWTSRCIPNAISLGGICSGFLLGWVDGNLMERVFGFLYACILIIPYRKGWLSGGDVKLMMAYAALLGLWTYIQLSTWAAFFSIIWILVYSHPSSPSGSCRQIPYAIPLAVAAWAIAAKEGVG